MAVGLRRRAALAALGRAARPGIAAGAALVVVESGAARRFVATVGFRLVDQRRSGKAVLQFLSRPNLARPLTVRQPIWIAGQAAQAGWREIRPRRCPPS